MHAICNIREHRLFSIIKVKEYIPWHIKQIGNNCLTIFSTSVCIMKAVYVYVMIRERKSFAQIIEYDS